jgi:hypothetical protein
MVLPCDLQLPLLVSKVQKIPPWIEFIPVSTTEKEEYQQDPDAKNDKAHLLMYLSSRHIGGKNKQAMVSNRSKSTNDNGQKGRDYKNYNRIVFFADCLQPGRVCSKILESQPASLTFFANMIHGGFGVGSLYVIEE